MVPERFVRHAVSEIPELICATGLLSGCPISNTGNEILCLAVDLRKKFSFNFYFKFYIQVHLEHSLLFTFVIYRRTERSTLPVYLDSPTGNLETFVTFTKHIIYVITYQVCII
jgi:hypothetical protein